ncbi:MAG: hypothetical protein LBI42_04500 [Chitinispirillales bacterium]|nr:hypothetical protein [Chitinispirillales bacterium]
MDASKEKRFYDSLGIVPQVSNGVLKNIERMTGRSNFVRRGLLAACFALAFIIPAFVLTKITPSAAYAGDYESISELIYAFEYFNGDFDNDNSAYGYLLDE